MGFSIELPVNGFQFCLTSDWSHNSGIVVNFPPEQVDDPKFIEALRIALDMYPAIVATYKFEPTYVYLTWGEAEKLYHTAYSSKYYTPPKTLIHYSLKYYKASHERYQKEHPPKALGYVYLLQSPTGAYKIGRTKNPKSRLKTFEVKLPFEVEFTALIQTRDMYQLEIDLHTKYASKKIKGEWFRLEQEDVDYIKGLAQ